jgi:hypothetical protein
MTEYADMDYKQLHAKLEKLLQVETSLAKDAMGELWAVRVEQVAALDAMHKLVAQPGRSVHLDPAVNWQQECELLGITPEQVRQMRKRYKAGPRKHSRTAVEDLKELCILLVDGKTKEARNLAAEWGPRYGFW